MTQISEAHPELPPLLDYSAPPEDPATVALDFTPGMLRLLVDARDPEHGYPDGIRLALASLKNGYNREQIGDMWVSHRNGLPQNEIGAAARRHIDEHLAVAPEGAVIPVAEMGELIIDYTRRILYGHLRRPARKEDTDTRLRTLRDYYIPGSRFDDPFPADNTIVGMALIAEGRIDEACGVLDNISHDTMRFGYSPNFAKVAAMRQQTPYDSFLVEGLRGVYGDEALLHYRPALVRNLKFMQAGKEQVDAVPLGHYAAHRRIVRLADGRHAYRAWDDRKVNFKQRIGGRPESILEDLELGERLIQDIEDEDEQAWRWERLMLSLGAACETMQDQADYQLADRKNLITSRTIEILTPWLQAAVANKIRLVAESYEISGDLATAEQYWQEFNELASVIDSMWVDIDETHGHHTDMLLDGTQTGALNAAQILPLLVPGLVSYDRAIKSINTFRDKLLGDHGLRTSDILDCTEQWSGDRAWPSLAAWAIQASMQAAVDAEARGLDPTPFIEFAADLTEALENGLEAWYAVHGTLPERIKDGAPTEVAVGGEYCKEINGKKAVAQVGFGMTAGSLLLAKAIRPREVEIDPGRGPWLRQGLVRSVGGLILPRSVAGVRPVAA